MESQELVSALALYNLALLYAGNSTSIDGNSDTIVENLLNIALEVLPDATDGNHNGTNFQSDPAISYESLIRVCLNFNLGIIHWRRGEVDSACRGYLRAIQLARTALGHDNILLGLALHSLGQLLLQTGRMRDAVEALHASARIFYLDWPGDGAPAA